MASPMKVTSRSVIDLCHGVRVGENAVQFIVEFRHRRSAPFLYLPLPAVHGLVDAVDQSCAVRALHQLVHHADHLRRVALGGGLGRPLERCSTVSPGEHLHQRLPVPGLHQRLEHGGVAFQLLDRSATEAVDRCTELVEETRKLTERNLEILATIRTRGTTGDRSQD